jgi:cephalosporin-C deacetylase-like acetyl esterase
MIGSDHAGSTSAEKVSPLHVLWKLSIAVASLGLIAASEAQTRWEAPVDCAAERRGVPPYAELAKVLRYDRKVPLDVHVLSTIDTQGVKLESVEFSITNGEVCSAGLVIPPGQGPFPAVVWFGSGDKDWQPFAIEFSKSGAVSFLLEYCGDASLVPFRALHENQVENVINVRRAVDILSSRKDVDRNRIAFVGHSGGAMLGADAVAVDGRFKAAVFESGLQGITYHVCTSPHPFAIETRKKLKDRLPEYVSTLAPLDAIHYIGHEAPTVLLFQSARLDQGVSQSDAQAFFDAASEPKQLIWYDTGHKMELPSVTKDRTEFLKKELQIH